MSRNQRRLVREAMSRYRRIFPCGTRARFDDCFTNNGDSLMFWFDTEDGSTHLVVGEGMA